MKPRPRRQRAATVFCGAALLLIGAETLFPHPERAALVAETPIWCLVCGDLGLLDVLLNVALFAPLGAGLALLGASWRRAMLVGGGLSLAIELTQYVAIPGRDASLSDLLTNTTGTVAGALLATSWRVWLLPSPPLARLFALGTAVAWLAQVSLVGTGVRPTLPSTEYWGQRAAELGQFDTFPGKVLDARVGRVSLPSHRLANSPAVRQDLLAGEALTVVAIPAGPTKGIAPLASIFDGDQREIAVLGQWNQDLIFRLRTRAIDLKLRPPSIRLSSVFRGEAGHTLTLSGAVRGGRFVVDAVGPAGHLSRVLPLSPQWGWSLLLPFDYAFGSEVGWVSALWVVCWLAPVGFWLRGTGIGPGKAAAVTVGLLTGGLAVIPALFRESPALLEWVAGAFGTGLGWQLAHTARRALGTR